MKEIKPYAPWSKDDEDDFKDVKELTIMNYEKIREQIADKALISSVKTIAELMREQDL